MGVFKPDAGYATALEDDAIEKRPEGRFLELARGALTPGCFDAQLCSQALHAFSEYRIVAS